MRDRQQGKNERKLSKNKPTDSSKFRTAVRRELWVGKGRERKGREGMGRGGEGREGKEQGGDGRGLAGPPTFDDLPPPMYSTLTHGKHLQQK